MNVITSGIINFTNTKNCSNMSCKYDYHGYIEDIKFIKNKRILKIYCTGCIRELFRKNCNFTGSFNVDNKKIKLNKCKFLGLNCMIRKEELDKVVKFFISSKDVKVKICTR